MSLLPCLVGLVCLPKNFRAGKLQVHQPSLRDACGSPLGNGLIGYLAQFSRSRSATEVVNDLVRVKGRIHDRY